MRIGWGGPSYIAQSSAIADEECINWFVETLGTQSVEVAVKAYGGATASGIRSTLRTPGLKVFCSLPGTPRGGIEANGRCFEVAGSSLCEIFSDGSFTTYGTVADDGKAASFAFNSIQILIVSGGHAYCFTLATNALLEVTDQLAGVPMQCDGSDTYGIVIFKNSNKYQMSQVLDYSTWPGALVNEVSVFPDNLVSMLVNHRELWLWGNRRSQPFQDTGSTEVFDPIPGALIETGSAATLCVDRIDNSVFWVQQDERGALIASRSNGYTPQRISTYSEELWFSQQANIAEMTSYSYQDRGHMFWVLYVPGADCSLVYDVTENLWHKRAAWVNGKYQPHWSWNHVFCFGRHLVGDWNSHNLYEMTFDALDDNGTNVRRLRRAPTVSNEMNWIRHTQLTVDFETGLGPQPPFLDGNNAPRPPQAILRWSDDRGKTWSNEHVMGCGFAGEFKTRVVWRRLGRSRYRVYELVVTDPIAWAIVDAYLEISNG